MQNEAPYPEAIVTKYPEQVVVAIARDESGKYNPITLGWTMITSHEPPMMAISVGKARYSLSAIRFAGEFVIAFPSADQADQVLLFGTQSGRDVDKFAAAGAATAPAKVIDSVLLSAAVANFECRLAGELETGDHVALIGEVVCSHVNPAKPSRLYTVGPDYQMGAFTPA